jgi:hypothetical protein
LLSPQRSGSAIECDVPGDAEEAVGCGHDVRILLLSVEGRIAENQTSFSQWEQQPQDDDEEPQQEEEPQREEKSRSRKKNQDYSARNDQGGDYRVGCLDRVDHGVEQRMQKPLLRNDPSDYRIATGLEARLPCFLAVFCTACLHLAQCQEMA